MRRLAMELGAACWMNTAIAGADPLPWPKVMKGCAGRLAHMSGRILGARYATASSPVEGWSAAR